MIVSLLVCEIQSKILQSRLQRVLKGKSLVHFLYLHLCSLLADDSGRDPIMVSVCVCVWIEIKTGYGAGRSQNKRGKTLTAEELGRRNHGDVEILGANFKFICKLKCVSGESVGMENIINFFKMEWQVW